MAAVLRVVHPSELLNCSRKRPTPPILWRREEEKPRCHECLKPVQDFSRLLKPSQGFPRHLKACQSFPRLPKASKISSSILKPSQGVSRFLKAAQGV